VLAPEYCRALIHLYEEGVVSGRVRARGTNVRDVSLSVVLGDNPQLSAWGRAFRDSVAQLLGFHFNLPGLFADYTAFKCEYEGGAHAPHADNVTSSGQPNHTHWREATAMLYLNDGETDFQGGRIRFVRLGREVVPKPGLLVGFGCGLHFEHEVTAVAHGKRYGLGFWFTRDPTYREPW
jgi:predicted 2-oxoglutarate/Fe(II)-dependent dioxygenase YbiX